MISEFGNDNKISIMKDNYLENNKYYNILSKMPATIPNEKSEKIIPLRSGY
jgi:hypothetical protein